MKKDKNLDELFRDKLLNYEQEPPAYLLENVLAGVAGARRNRKIVFWRISGVAAALLLAFIAGWQINFRNGQDIKKDVIVSQQSAPEISAEEKTELASSTIANQPENKDSNTENLSEKVNSQRADLVHEKQIKKSESKSILKNSGNEQMALANENYKLASDGNQNTADRIKTIAKNSKSEQITSSDESLIAQKSDDSMLLKPFRSLFRLKNGGMENSAKNLLAIKKEVPQAARSEKTIDQQIMEQNRQTLMAQNQAKGKSRWLVGAQVSPEYSISRSNHSQVYASNMLNSSTNPVDLGGGISVELKKGKRWSLQSGVYYSGMGQSSGNSNISAGKDFAFASSNRGSEYFNTNATIDASNSKMMMNSTAGVIEFKGIPAGIELGANLEDKTMVSNAVVVSNARFIQNFEYIEIPLYLRYTLLDSKFDVEMLGGFSSNLLVGNQTFMESSAGKNRIGSTKDMEPMNYSGTLGIGLKYGLSKHVSLNVEPRVKYFLNSLNSNASVTYKPYTIGVFTGLSYEF